VAQLRDTNYVVKITLLYVKKTPNCLIKNLFESESLPHLKIYTKISQLFPGRKATGGRNEVNDAREKEGNGNCCTTISKAVYELFSTCDEAFGEDKELDKRRC
jgi:hypothetical protein